MRIISVFVILIVWVELVCALPVSGVLDDGQGDFDPWNKTRWAAWYVDGKLAYSFDIDCSLRFASRSTAWEVDLSELEGDWGPRLFRITTNASIDIDGNGVIVDARLAHTQGWSLAYWYTKPGTDNFGVWRGIYLEQTGEVVAGDNGSRIYDITLIGFRAAVEFGWDHRRLVTIAESTFKIGRWLVFPRGANGVIENCQIIQGYDSGVYAETESHNFVFSGNTFQDNNIRGVISWSDLILDACYDFTIINNSFLPASYLPSDYHTAISLYRNRGENDLIRPNASRGHVIQGNYFEDRNVAIDQGIRAGRINDFDLAFEGRCYSNNVTVQGNTFEDCRVGINTRSSFNHFKNNTFNNVDREIVLLCPFYKSVFNTIEQQSGTTVWLWAMGSDPGSYYDDVHPYGFGVGDEITAEEKLYFIRSDGSASFVNPGNVKLVIADTILQADPEDFDADFQVDITDLRWWLEDWLGNGAGRDLDGDGQVDLCDYSYLADRWGRGNDLQDYFDNGGCALDVAVGDFARDLPGDEIAIIWDDPVSNIEGTEYYTIIFYDSNGVEFDRCGRSQNRWGQIAGGDFIANLPTNCWSEVVEDEIAAVSSVPDSNGKYSVYIFRRGWKDAAQVLLADNSDPVADITAGQFNTNGDVYDELAVIFETGSTDITYVKPLDSGWTSNTTVGTRLMDIAAGNLDGYASNGDEIVGIVRPDPALSLVAAWDFEDKNGGALVDKAPAGKCCDDLTVLGTVIVSDGRAQLRKDYGGALRALDSQDLNMQGDFTIWIRAKVCNDPTSYISMVDKRRFFGPQERSYAFLINTSAKAQGGAVADHFGLGGQICADGVSGGDEIWDVDGAEIVPISEVRELVMRCADKGALQVEWLASTVTNPTVGNQWQIVNGMTYQENVREIFQSTTDLYLGNTVNADPQSATVDYYEVRIYQSWLDDEQLADIIPGAIDHLATTEYKASVYRTGSSSVYRETAVSANPWQVVAAGEFVDEGRPLEEMALISSVTGGRKYSVDYYKATSQVAIKSVLYDVMTVEPSCLDTGNLFVGEVLSDYEKCSGLASGDYGADMADWGDDLMVLPAQGNQSDSIPAYFLRSSSDGSSRYFKMVPVLR